MIVRSLITAVLLLAATSRAGAQTPKAPAPAPGSASGAAPTAPAQPELVPPRLVHAEEVPYPAGAEGDATVTLTLVVNRDGSVRSATATIGSEPFASAAAEAARAFRFDPATRAGQAVAATIRFEVKFAAPVTTEVPLEAPTQPSAVPSGSGAPPPPPPPAPTQDVRVQGERRAAAVTSLTRAEVRQLPGAFGDPFRAIEALPGVTPIVSGLPFFYVRGAPPGNVGYFLDGIRVPYLYHIALGPSIVNPALVERVDLYPGGYPARYGRYTGGIVAGETTVPRADWHGEANLRIFDVGGTVEGGFAGGRGTVLLGGRYSYTAAVLSLIADDVKLDYRDYQARVSYDVTPHDRVSAFAFGSYDLLGQEQPQGLRVLFGTEFYRLDLRYDHFYGADNRLRFAATLGFDQTNLDANQNSQDRMLGLRVELDHRLSSKALLRAGADANLDNYSITRPSYVDPDDPDLDTFERLFPERNDYAFGIRGDLVLDVTRNIEVTPGVRADIFKSGYTTKSSVDARLAGKFRISRWLRLLHAYGLAHQPPSFVIPIPGLTPTLAGGLQTSFQTSAGAELTLPADITATATLFHSTFFDMTDDLGTAQDNVELGTTRSLGNAYGLELYVHRALTQKLGGYLSYTLSRSTRSIGREHFLSVFDRTHVGSLALAYDLGRRWRAGSRFVFYTGIPFRPDNVEDQPRTLDTGRAPPFYRLDVRLEKRWILGKTAWLAFVLEMLNATFHKETLGDTAIGPITIPSIGLEGGF